MNHSPTSFPLVCDFLVRHLALSGGLEGLTLARLFNDLREKFPGFLLDDHVENRLFSFISDRIPSVFSVSRRVGPLSKTGRLTDSGVQYSDKAEILALEEISLSACLESSSNILFTVIFPIRRRFLGVCCVSEPSASTAAAVQPGFVGSANALDANVAFDSVISSHYCILEFVGRHFYRGVLQLSIQKFLGQSSSAVFAHLKVLKTRDFLTSRPSQLGNIWYLNQFDPTLHPEPAEAYEENNRLMNDSLFLGKKFRSNLLNILEKIRKDRKYQSKMEENADGEGSDDGEDSSGQGDVDGRGNTLYLDWARHSLITGDFPFDRSKTFHLYEMIANSGMKGISSVDARQNSLLFHWKALEGPLDSLIKSGRVVSVADTQGRALCYRYLTKENYENLQASLDRQDSVEMKRRPRNPRKSEIPAAQAEPRQRPTTLLESSRLSLITGYVNRSTGIGTALELRRFVSASEKSPHLFDRRVLTRLLERLQGEGIFSLIDVVDSRGFPQCIFVRPDIPMDSPAVKDFVQRCMFQKGDEEDGEDQQERDNATVDMEIFESLNTSRPRRKTANSSQPEERLMDTTIISSDAVAAAFSLANSLGGLGNLRTENPQQAQPRARPAEKSSSESSSSSSSSSDSSDSDSEHEASAPISSRNAHNFFAAYTGFVAPRGARARILHCRLWQKYAKSGNIPTDASATHSGFYFHVSELLNSLSVSDFIVLIGLDFPSIAGRRALEILRPGHMELSANSPELPEEIREWLAFSAKTRRDWFFYSLKILKTMRLIKECVVPHSSGMLVAGWEIIDKIQFAGQEFLFERPSSESAVEDSSSVIPPSVESFWRVVLLTFFPEEFPDGPFSLQVKLARKIRHAQLTALMGSELLRQFRYRAKWKVQAKLTDEKSQLADKLLPPGHNGPLKFPMEEIASAAAKIGVSRHSLFCHLGYRDFPWCFLSYLEFDLFDLARENFHFPAGVDNNERLLEIREKKSDFQPEHLISRNRRKKKKNQEETEEMPPLIGDSPAIAAAAAVQQPAELSLGALPPVERLDDSEDSQEDFSSSSSSRGIIRRRRFTREENEIFLKAYNQFITEHLPNLATIPLEALEDIDWKITSRTAEESFQHDEGGQLRGVVTDFSPATGPSLFSFIQSRVPMEKSQISRRLRSLHFSLCLPLVHVVQGVCKTIKSERKLYSTKLSDGIYKEILLSAPLTAVLMLINEPPASYSSALGQFFMKPFTSGSLQRCLSALSQDRWIIRTRLNEHSTARGWNFSNSLSEQIKQGENHKETNKLARETKAFLLRQIEEFGFFTGRLPDRLSFSTLLALMACGSDGKFSIRWARESRSECRVDSKRLSIELPEAIQQRKRARALLEELKDSPEKRQRVVDSTDILLESPLSISRNDFTTATSALGIPGPCGCECEGSHLQGISLLELANSIVAEVAKAGLSGLSLLELYKAFPAYSFDQTALTCSLLFPCRISPFILALRGSLADLWILEVFSHSESRLVDMKFREFWALPQRMMKEIRASRGEKKKIEVEILENPDESALALMHTQFLTSEQMAQDEEIPLREVPATEVEARRINGNFENLPEPSDRVPHPTALLLHPWRILSGEFHSSYWSSVCHLVLSRIAQSPGVGFLALSEFCRPLSNRELLFVLEHLEGEQKILSNYQKQEKISLFDDFQDFSAASETPGERIYFPTISI